MHTYTASIQWRRGTDEAFDDGRYSRVHDWSFDGGVTLRASASPTVVPEPYADASAVDPEEAFVASLSSCHMLWFLHVASDRGFVVDRYHDAPTGTMDDDDGTLWMTRVTLRPRVDFAGDGPSDDELDAMHDVAHHACFLANSVRTSVHVEPVSTS